MNENQINFFLSENLKKYRNRDLKSFYLGTFASDEISSKNLRVNTLTKPLNFCFICNSLTRENDKEPGHWLLISIHFSPLLKKMNVKFMDSFALPYRHYGGVSKYIDNLRQQSFTQNIYFCLESLSKPLQYSESEICGVYFRQNTATVKRFC